MNVIDMHCDTLSVLLQKEKQGEEADIGQNDLMVDLNRMRNSGYMLQTFAAFIHAGSVENPLPGSALSEAIRISRKIRKRGACLHCCR